MQLYVSSTKRKALAALTAARQVPASTVALLTTQHLATSLHAGEPSMHGSRLLSCLVWRTTA